MLYDISASIADKGDTMLFTGDNPVSVAIFCHVSLSVTFSLHTYTFVMSHDVNTVFHLFLLF